MSRKEKLIMRFVAKPKDFTFEETCILLGFLGYRQDNKGKTSGSAVSFVSMEHPPILFHKPHPGNIMRQYQLKQLKEMLEKEGLI